jgi:dihydropteroate synthase
MLNSRVEDTNFYSKNSINIGGKLLNLSIPKLMGIINCTSDSFYSKSRFNNLKAVIQEVEKKIFEGVDIIDIGGNSSRPGSKLSSIEDEIKITAPIISALKKEFPNLIISVDTFRGEVAEKAIEAGASIINDISGFDFDTKMIDCLKKYPVPYILMHSKGTFETMHEQDKKSSFKEICFYFSEKISILKSIGIKDIILDPGFGFSKTFEQNYGLLNRLDDFTFLNHPLLVGFSRKSMIYKKLMLNPEDSLNGTTVLNTLSLQKGAKILRVHDVKEAKEIIKLMF